MINETHADERRHLEDVKSRIAAVLAVLDGRVNHYAQDAREQKKYIWENKGDMDHVEKISARESAQQTVRAGEVAQDARRRLQKLLQSPYFGRFDFAVGDDARPVYVGVHSFVDDAARENVVFDWRAPISSMFYDYELGAAAYHAPSGKVRGEITAKRQYRIRRGKMEFMLESGLNIIDDVLQEELSRTSDDRMKTIVATIQRDQNAIIRNEDAEVLIIQGVAGSGKTSIALHRIAFLLYRFKDTLASKDILILSPNKVFGDFISNVLPELGEEHIPERGMEELADELLGRRFKFETSLDQAARLLDGSDPELERRIRVKSSEEFLGKLSQYVRHVEATRFVPVDVPVDDKVVPASFIERAFRKRSHAPLNERIRWVVECVDHEAWVRWGQELSGKDKAVVRAAVKKMCRNPALRTLYRELFDWLGDPELFKPRRSALEFSDVFPMIYLKLRLERGDGAYGNVKHLVIDEMQDYTPVQYAVIAMLFGCNMTILGDVNQSINAWAPGTAESIAGFFRYSECVKLCKSYRSSYEITQFAQSICPSEDLQAIERHGSKPQVVSFEDERAEVAFVLGRVRTFAERGHQTMGIICKTPAQAKRLFGAIRKAGPDVHLLAADSTAFATGVVVCSTHLAKGLEFDEVLVPRVTRENYATPLDRSLLYVACTRAMHELVLTHAGPLSSFVADDSLYEVTTRTGAGASLLEDGA